MFGKILLIAALALIAWAALARASHGAGPEQRYTVKPGDTLWSIAVSHYAGDPRDAVGQYGDLAERRIRAGIAATLALPLLSGPYRNAVIRRSPSWSSGEN